MSTQEDLWHGIVARLDEAYRDNTIVRIGVNMIRRGDSVEDETIEKLLLEKPLKPMALGDHTGKTWLFTPPGWKGPT